MDNNFSQNQQVQAGVRLAVGILSLLVLGLIYGWSLFKAPLQEMFPTWTDSQLSTGFTILMSFYAVGGITSGQLSKLRKPRFVYLIMATLMLVGFWGASTMDPSDSSGSLIRLYLTYCLLCGLGTGLGYNLCTTTTVKWFPNHPGFALGTLLMGYGLGALCMGGIVTTLNDSFGLLTTFRIMGTGVFFLFLICSLFIALPKEERVASVKKIIPDSGSFTPKEAVRTPSFWMLLAWAIIASSAFMIVVGNASSVISYFGAPAILGMVISVTNGLSRVVSGSLMDRFGFKKVSLVHNIEILISAGTMLIGCLSGSVPVLVIGLLLSGLGFGCTPTTQAYYLRSRFGPAYFSAISSFSSPGLLVSSVLGSTLSGFLQDMAPAGAKYTSSIVLMMVYAVIGFILSFGLRKAADVPRAAD